MAAHSTFAGLKGLMARAGLRIGATGDPETIKPADGEDADGDAPAGEGDETETDTDTGAPEGDTPADTPAGDTEEGETDGEDDENTGNDSDAAGDTTGREAGAKPVSRSADFLAGQRHGATVTAGRFAAVLVSPVARANLEMATDLLANSTMTPSAIIEHCDRYKGENSAKRLLEQTPKMALGDGDDGGQKEGTEARASRQSAVSNVNKRTGRGAKTAGTPVRPSRRAAANRTPPAK